MTRPVGGEAAKRVVDMAGAAVALAVLAPVMAAVAGAVRASLGRPVLYRQVRPGRGGRPFTIYKFRTMRDIAGPGGEPLPDEERMTRLGRLLRRTSLDELPELFNVLRGDMSLVGPRPLLVEYLPRYSAEQARRHDVKPGITGWAQVNGRNALSWDDKLALDVWYVEHRSLALDFRILAMTLRAVASGRGISHRDHVTMPPFLGGAVADGRDR